MSDYSYVLGTVIKKAREKKGITQADLAALVQKDPRTILNIENSKGNPRLDLLYALISILNIDAREIFNPDLNSDTAHLREFHMLVDTLTDDEAERLIPVLQTALDALRSHRYIPVE